MRFEQKKHGNQTSFVMQNERMEYKFQDKNSEISFKVDYEQVPFDRMKFTETNEWFRRAGILWLIIGAIFTFLSFTSSESPNISIWLFIGAGCMAAYMIRKTRFIAYDTNKGRILIIEDENSEDIENLIVSRRAQIIKERYGKINFHNSPQGEVSRFEWMEENGVITHEELLQFKNQIREALQDSSESLETE